MTTLETPRTYVIGLPVVITLYGSGVVAVEVDTSEMSVAKVLGEHSDYSDAEIGADAERLAQWAQTHPVMVAG